MPVGAIQRWGDCASHPILLRLPIRVPSGPFTASQLGWWPGTMGFLMFSHAVVIRERFLGSWYHSWVIHSNDAVVAIANGSLASPNTRRMAVTGQHWYPEGSAARAVLALAQVERGQLVGALGRALAELGGRAGPCGGAGSRR